MRFALSLVALLVLSCAARQPGALAPELAPITTHDPSSYAEPARVRVTSLDLSLTVDFETRTLGGSAALSLRWLDDTATALVLDTRDLTIERVETGDGEALPFTLAARDPVFGQKLTITAPTRPELVRVVYHTSPDASGLLWLEPSMTAGQKQPFLFSQSQAIHARSWIPLQDTPGVRFPYRATIKTPPGVKALMSAAQAEPGGDPQQFSFRMAQPIPSYLVALAVGDLVFRPISARSGVWAEPSVVDGANAEFADTERMIVEAEKLYGAYRWERYDILVLPPSFPYGGMENPRLTFATPTIIVGDKSLVNLIAHELAHSWSGNLVTNSSWKDGWLNEGFTSYVEGRLTEVLYGAEASAMESVISQHDLETELPRIPPGDQLLALPPFGTRDPDEVLTDIQYVKGQWFLTFLEQRLGRAVFDPFLRSWFDDHAFQSTDSAEFERVLTALLAQHPGKVSAEEVRVFLHEPGIPPFAPRAVSSRLSAVDGVRNAFLAGTTGEAELRALGWSTQERVYFLEGMPDVLAHDKLAALDRAFALSGTNNGELAMRWYPLAEHNRYAEARAPMAAFLGRVGRRKLIRPIYEALVKSEEGRAFARDVFEKAKDHYHPIARATVDELIHSP